MKNIKVLVTCGPTWVAIDQVRVISNHSSGQMGHLIAEEFLKQKVQVTVIEGPVTHAWANKSAKIIKYQYFDELQKILDTELKKNYDLLIHAAAVSDFKVAKVVKGKISSAKTLSLKLVPALKLINSIKRKAPKTILVGFKLEPDLKVASIAKETEALFKVAKCDVVVANTLKNGYQGFVVNDEGQIVAQTKDKKRLAKELVEFLI